MKNRTEEDWKCVIFSAKTKINRISCHPIEYSRAKNSEKLGPEMVEVTPRFCGVGKLIILSIYVPVFWCR